MALDPGQKRSTELAADHLLSVPTATVDDLILQRGRSSGGEPSFRGDPALESQRGLVRRVLLTLSGDEQAWPLSPATSVLVLPSDASLERRFYLSETSESLPASVLRRLIHEQQSLQTARFREGDPVHVFKDRLLHAAGVSAEPHPLVVPSLLEGKDSSELMLDMEAHYHLNLELLKAFQFSLEGVPSWETVRAQLSPEFLAKAYLFPAFGRLLLLIPPGSIAGKMEKISRYHCQSSGPTFRRSHYAPGVCINGYALGDPRRSFDSFFESQEDAKKWGAIIVEGAVPAPQDLSFEGLSLGAYSYFATRKLARFGISPLHNLHHYLMLCAYGFFPKGGLDYSQPIDIKNERTILAAPGSWEDSRNQLIWNGGWDDDRHELILSPLKPETTSSQKYHYRGVLEFDPFSDEGDRP